MHHLTRISLAHRTVIVLLGLLAIAAGIFTTSTLKQELIPSMELPQGAVIAVYPGAGPEVVESEVAKPIEAAVAGLAGVTQVTSTSSSNYAQISLQWDYENDSEEMANKISRAVDSLTLPTNVTTRTITGSMDDLPVLMLSVASNDELEVLSKKIDDLVVPELKGVDGVRDVSVSGEETKEVSIILDQDKVQKYGVDQSMISANTFMMSGMAIPAGTIASSNGSYDVQVGSTFSSVEEVQNLLVAGTDDPVKLGTIAKIEIVKVDATSYSRVNGRPSLTISITKTLAGNTVSTSHGVMDKLDSLAASLGNGTEFKVIFDQSPFIEDSIRDLSTEGGIGLVMAIIIIMFFLWSVKPTLITAISIPLSLLIAMIGLYVGGDSLNILTLGALTVAIGRVVDDSIVIIENIKRHQSMGQIGRPATIAAVKEVAGAVTSSTLTTVAVFLPIGLVGGQVGEMFRPFAVTVTIALLASLVVSMTVVPVLASWFMRVKNLPETATIAAKGEISGDVAATSTLTANNNEDDVPQDTLLQKAYVPVLGWALAHRALTVAIAFVLFVGTMALVPFLKTDFIGDMGQNMVSISMKLPTDTGLADADAAARKVEELLAKESDIDAYQTNVGGGSGIMAMMMGSSGSGSNQVSITISMKDGTESKPMVERLREQTAKMPELGKIQIGAAGTTGASSQVKVYVEAADQEKLEAGAAIVQQKLEGISGLVNVNSDLASDSTMLKIDLNEDIAADKGYTKATIGAALTRAIRGQKVGTIAQGDTTLDIYLRSQAGIKNISELPDVLLPVTQQMTMQARLDAADKVSEKADKLADDAKAEGTKAFNKQVKTLQKSRATAKKTISKLKKQSKAATKKLGVLQDQLQAAMAVPPSATNPEVTALVLSLYSQVNGQVQAVMAIQQGIAQASAGVSQIDSSITALYKQRDSSQEAQDKQAALTEEGKDAQKKKAKPIQLKKVATVNEIDAPVTITRVDGSRAATVTATTEGTDLSSINAQLTEVLADMKLPEGVSYRIGGISTQQAEAFSQMFLAMLVAVGLVYLIMVATFGSLAQPFILLISILFAATGVVGASLLTDTAIGIPSMIGMLMLIGIVVTNAIVLIDLINQYRKRGHQHRASALHGASLRVRPVIMTALATIFALLPMGLGITGGSVFISKPLAIVVMGGLISSTLVTLILVPVLYDLMEQARELVANRKTRRKTPPILIDETRGTAVVGQPFASELGETP